MTIIECHICNGEGSIEVPDLQDIEKATVKRILLGVAKRHGVTPGEITSPKRTPTVSAARFEAAWTMRQWLPDMTLGTVGHYLNRDHSSIIHAIAQHKLRNGL